MKILIIEDEAPAYRRLIKLVEECIPDGKIAGIIQSVKDGLEWFQVNEAPDLILSDIQLADDLSFRIFSELKLKIPVIFITAYDEYAINAFKFHSIDYLLKPINAADLQESIEKYRHFKGENKKFEDFEKMLKSLSVRDYRNRFLIYSGDSLFPVTTNEIAYFFSEDGATFLVHDSGKKYIINESLDQLEKELDPKCFTRANRQFIVAARSVKKIHNYGNQKLKLNLNPEPLTEVVVSKLRAGEFKEWMNT